jgi:mycothiol synthase
MEAMRAATAPTIFAMLPKMSDIIIRTCPPNRHREALELVLGAIEPEQRGVVVESLRPVAERGMDVFAGLVVAEVGPRMIGAAWLQPQAGRTATLWPPKVVDGVARVIGRQLAAAALAECGNWRTVLAQTLLDSPSDPFAGDLLALGFTHLADLKYLMTTVPQRTRPPNVDIQLTSPAYEDADEFKQLILQSYESTLDCPALEGLRDIRDVLEGYQTVGKHDPALWSIVQLHGRPVGVLLLAPYPESHQWELVYMGVVPRARGKHIGRQILDVVRYRASQAGIGHVVLAVDAANHPALRMYEAAGYVEWSRRTAYIKHMDVSSAE